MSEFGPRIQLENILRKELRPWESLHGNDLVGQLAGFAIPIIAIARMSGLSPRKVLKNTPRRISLNGLDFIIKLESELKKAETKDGDIKKQPCNIGIKRLIRQSVDEPPIRGVRNGGRRLNEKKLATRIKQAKVERDKFCFLPVDSSTSMTGKDRRRQAIKSRLAERAVRKLESFRLGGIKINENDPKLKTLKSLVSVPTADIEQIVQNALDDPEICLFDFVDSLGLDKEVLQRLEENTRLLKAVIPENRATAVSHLNRIINTTPTMHSLSKTRIHPSTSFESGVPLFFGMGGGSKMPCQGLPVDVLKMVFTGEKLRRELGLTQCFVLGADVITYTNIGQTAGFTKEKIDQVIGAEVALLNELFRRFGFHEWKAIRQSQLLDHFPKEKVEEWQHHIEEADSVSFVGGHHYAIEMSDIQLLVPNGVKLGWFIRPLTMHTGYIMDEQPFHARFALLMALLGKPHATTLLYTHAGTRLIPGEDGSIQKEAPYITYTPYNRLLLGPFEDVNQKLIWAERRGGGLLVPFIREQFQSISSLFEELLGEISVQGRTENEILSNKLQFIINQGVGNDFLLKKMWREAFPNSL